ncbi:MAG: hypothetical protein EXS03_03935 [Phycisphaerales bacterium]|nr:hypothetical protein [Phycisphaerales bacterium]
MTLSTFGVLRPSCASAAALALLVASASAHGQAVAGGSRTSLPLTSVTLYRSGVGYFERNGSVKSGDSVQLRFANDEINDMLKSMVILDPEHALESVSYESKEPLSRQLASFGIDLSDNPTLAGLLGRLRGTRVKIGTADGTVEGVILGGETRQKAEGHTQEPLSVPFINVVTPAGVISVDLNTAVSVALEDAALNAELIKALAALASHTTDRFKTVEITFGGKTAREVVVSYVNEMPIWKTSYRLVLRDDKKASEKPLIQGWAIVENTTDDDWNDVELALVASQPVSFEMDLAQSLHITRPQLPVPMVAGAAPRIYSDGDAFAANRSLHSDARKMASPGSPPITSAPAPVSLADASVAGFDGGGGVEPRHRAGSARQEGGEVAMSRGGLFGSSPMSEAQGGSVGEAFQYTLSNPISIARQQSAMLPILTGPIDARRVSIFNAHDGIEHPMRGLELKNTTGLQLIPGPIAVYDGFAYAGDAEIGYMTLNDSRLLAYAVDLSVAAAEQSEQTSHVRSIRIVDGAIEQTYQQLHRVSYAFNNKDTTKGRTILVEAHKLHDWALVEPKKPAEETANLYRFEIELAPGAKGTLVVAQEHTGLERLGVVGYNMATLLSFATDGKASPAVVKAVTKAAEMQSEINATNDRIARLEQERTGIDADQSRIRQNMNSIDHASEVYRRYLAKFGDQETRLEAIRAETEKERSTLAAQQQALNGFVRTLNVS